MSRRRVTIDVDDTTHTCYVRGWQTGDMIRDASIRPIWSHVSRCYMIDLRRLPDLVAYLEYRNINAVVRDRVADKAVG